MTREEFVRLVEECDDVVELGFRSRFADDIIAIYDAQRAEIERLTQERDRLRTALDRMTNDTVLDKQQTDYYKRIMKVWVDWAQEALRGAGEDKRNAEGPAIDPPARGDFPPEPS